MPMRMMPSIISSGTALLLRLTCSATASASASTGRCLLRLLSTHPSGPPSSARSVALPPDPAPSTPYEPPTHPPTYIVRKKGMELLQDPLYNKGTAFPPSERDRLDLRGLVPPSHLTLEIQQKRFMDEYEKPRLISPEEAKLGGVTSEMARRWRLLQALQDRNETLFYKVLMDNFVEMAPVIYTPTVGWVCINYHHLYRRPRGMFFSAADKGEMAAMVWNWPQDDVQAIVVTDGSRILGLGDLGVNGLGIPVGKLDLYVAAAGFNPRNVLPVVIDVGTNNSSLRDDIMYLGLKHPRITGQEYYNIMDEFVSAVMHRWPTAVLQFEDFCTSHALTLLERYRGTHLVFNDDIQGTAATALAGLYGAMRVLGLTTADLAKQRVLCVGAGSAGMGVTRMIATGMEKQGLSPEGAAAQFWVCDNKGLITTSRLDSLAAHVKPFARHEEQYEGEGILEVINRVKPTILLGLAGAGKLFTEPVLRAMNAACAGQRPIIFPMSNPISRMECSSEEAVRFTDGRAIVAVGSPQPDVELEGRLYTVSQANNMYIFPGLALGAYLGNTRNITDAMLTKAAETLPSMISQEDLDKGMVYPRLSDIRQISASIAVEVMKCAAEEGILRGKALEKLKQSEAKLLTWTKGNMFSPNYSSLVQLPIGVQQ